MAKRKVSSSLPPHAECKATSTLDACSEAAVSATLPPCPKCEGPRDSNLGDTLDRLCSKCRSEGQLREGGSLLQVRTAIALQPKSLNRLPLWREIRYFGRKLWGPNEPDKLLDVLLDWLAGEHGKPEHVALWMQRSEVLDLLRAAVKESPAVGGRDNRENDTAQIEAHTPLTEAQKEVYDWIRRNGPLAGKEIANKIGLSESTITAHYIPALKKHGIVNRRGLGYCPRPKVGSSDDQRWNVPVVAAPPDVDLDRVA